MKIDCNLKIVRRCANGLKMGCKRNECSNIFSLNNWQNRVAICLCVEDCGSIRFCAWGEIKFHLRYIKYEKLIGHLSGDVEETLRYIYFHSRYWCFIPAVSQQFQLCAFSPLIPSVPTGRNQNQLVNSEGGGWGREKNQQYPSLPW